MITLCIGDIVAPAGRSIRMMVVDIDPSTVTVAYIDAGAVHERIYHNTALVLLFRPNADKQR